MPRFFFSLLLCGVLLSIQSDKEFLEKPAHSFARYFLSSVDFTAAVQLIKQEDLRTLPVHNVCQLWARMAFTLP